MYSVTVQKSDTVQNIVVHILVSSLKALYFTHVTTAPDGFISASLGYKGYTTSYQLFVESVAIPTTPVHISALGDVNAEDTYTEVTWHICLNDQDMGTLLQPGQSWDECAN